MKDSNSMMNSLKEEIIRSGAPADKVEELIALAGEKNITPVVLEIPEEDIQQRYRLTEAWEIVKTRKEIYFHANSYWLVSRPTMAEYGGHLYRTLSGVCNILSMIEDLDEDTRSLAQTWASVVAEILSLPLDVFCDPGMTIEIGTEILRIRRIYYERLLAQIKTSETAEDCRENDAFDAGRQVTEILMQQFQKQQKS